MDLILCYYFIEYTVLKVMDRDTINKEKHDILDNVKQEELFLK